LVEEEEKKDVLVQRKGEEIECQCFEPVRGNRAKLERSNRNQCSGRNRYGKDERNRVRERACAEDGDTGETGEEDVREPGLARTNM